MNVFLPTPSRIFAALLAACFLFLAGCNEFKQMMPKVPPAKKVQPLHPDIAKAQTPEPDPAAEPKESPRVTSDPDHVTQLDFLGASHDLAPDELAGGHTLSKHVARTDAELRDRLARENIPAASTYTDRTAAQFAVGNALQHNATRIEIWMARSTHPNLVLDYHSDHPVGRALHRGDSSSHPCSDAKIVLRWLSSSEYFVLTSYPEGR
jgi:hypothetical protein